MDNVREDLKERNIDLTRIGEATRNREVWRNLVSLSFIVSMLMEERKEDYLFSFQNMVLRIVSD